jgi:tRNA G18 (ribose-2'-O)-methylase SpoU
LGASGIFTIGHRYKSQASDVYKSARHIPLRHYETLDDFMRCRPIAAKLIGIEMGGTPLSEFVHPRTAVYLLGAEDYGLPAEIIKLCQGIVSLQAVNQASYNVAVAGSIVMYDRIYKPR